MKVQSILEKVNTKLQAECERLGEKIPYIAENGVYKDDMREVNKAYWTNGFWAGMLWEMYAAEKNEMYRKTAEATEKVFDKAMEEFEALYHDVGFMYLHTAVADYKLTGNEQSRVRALHAADILLGRYNASGKFIRAWNKDMIGWIIIDCLMNLPLLYWASKETGDPRYAYAAEQHADTALIKLLRPDGSSNHIAVLDPVTGEVLEYPAGQGYASGSSWSRGQACAVYGFALSALHTGKEKYLDAAKRAAHYFIANVSRTEYVARVDFRSPEEKIYWDTTASACAACGLLQIAEMVPELEKNLYRDSAVKMLDALDKKYCDYNPNTDGIVQYGTVAYEREGLVHVPIIYGDYFYTEALLRLADKYFPIW